MTRALRSLGLLVAVWLAAPIVIVVVGSLHKKGPEGASVGFPTLDTFAKALAMDAMKTIGLSVEVALVGALLTISLVVIISCLARTFRAWERNAILVMVAVPLLTSLVPRAFAILKIVDNPGTRARLRDLASELPASQLARSPDDSFLVVLGLLYTYAPYGVLIAWAALAAVSDVQIMAARDLGATTFALTRDLLWRSVARTIVGVWAVLGVVMTVDFVVPKLFGTGKVLYLGAMIDSVFFRMHDRPLACAVAVLGVLSAVVAVSVAVALGRAGMWAASRLGCVVRAEIE